MRFSLLLLPLLVAGILSFSLPVFAVETNALQSGWSIIPAECKCDAANNLTQPGIDSAPDFACAGIVLNRVLNLAFSLGIVIFVIVISYAGILLMANSVNPSGKEQAKSMITNAVIGFMIALAAWLLVDFVMKALYDNQRFGPWNEILLNRDAKHCLVVTNPPQGQQPSGTGVEAGPGTAPNEDRDNDGRPNSEDTDDDGDNLPDETDNCKWVKNENQADADGDNVGDACETAPTAGGGEFSLRGIDARQRSDAAPQLTQLLSCMATKPGTSGAVITSISDDYLYTRNKTWDDCRAGECQHTRNSWHYGGANGGDHSLAVDFGNNSNSATVRQALESAACSCNSSVRILQEGGGSIGNSLHISFGASEGRGCR